MLQVFGDPGARTLTLLALRAFGIDNVYIYIVDEQGLRLRDLIEIREADDGELVCRLCRTVDPSRSIEFDANNWIKLGSAKGD
ncbi:MAG: hypothetical protein ABIH03_07020 [Pseudomonadota bacterium]